MTTHTVGAGPTALLLSKAWSTPKLQGGCQTTPPGFYLEEEGLQRKTVSQRCSKEITDVHYITGVVSLSISLLCQWLLQGLMMKLWAQHPDLALTAGAAEPVWLLTRIRRGETSIVFGMQSLRRRPLSGSWMCRAGTRE